MSASLCMSMASLAVSGAGRGVTAARMGRAAASKGAVAGSSAFFPAKASAKMTMKSSLAGACALPSPDEREPRNARRRDRARDRHARSDRVHRTRRAAARPVPRVDGASDPGARPAGVGKKRLVGHRGFFPSRGFLDANLILHPSSARETHDTKHAFVALTSRSSSNRRPFTKQRRRRRSPRRRRAQARCRPRRAGGGGGRPLHRVHAAGHAPRARAHVRVPRAPGDPRRAPHAQAPPQEGAQVPRAGGRAQHVEQGEAQEPQVRRRGERIVANHGRILCA